MPNTTEDCSSWAIVFPPLLFMVFMPNAPSCPIPVNVTPIVFIPKYSADDIIVTFAAGLTPNLFGPSTSFIFSWESTSICRSPGATRAVPSVIRSPSWASLTFISQFSSSLSANFFVKPFGMCCTTKIPARMSAGNVDSIDCTTPGPPVDEAIVTTTDAAWGEIIAFLFGFRFFIFSKTAFCGSDCAAAFILVINVSFRIVIFSGFNWEIGTKSIAPFSNASNTIFAPSWLKLLTKIVGISVPRLTISSMNVNPSIRGISRSSSITSGFCTVIFLNASIPSLAISHTRTVWLEIRSFSNVLM